MSQSSGWYSLPVAAGELSLARTLPSGQAFRWRNSGEGQWTGVVGERLFTLAQTPTELRYCIHTPSSPTSDRAALRDYFRLKVKLSSLYHQWSEVDANFREKAAHYPGVRLLRQDPFEALIAFICSSNNNIARISKMLQRLCETFGCHLGHWEGQAYHSFPSLEALAADGMEDKLRGLGFGYRAKYVHQSARFILDKPSGILWLHGLRSSPYPEAWAALKELPGVGDKVADCVCLMGLDKMEAVPVDTHMLQLAGRDYGTGKKGRKRTASKLAYKEVGDMFRSVFGDFAGWAQAVGILQVLFTAELNRSELPPQGLADAPKRAEKRKASCQQTSQSESSSKSSRTAATAVRP